MKVMSIRGTIDKNIAPAQFEVPRTVLDFFKLIF